MTAKQGKSCFNGIAKPNKKIVLCTHPHVIPNILSVMEYKRRCFTTKAHGDQTPSNGKTDQKGPEN